jgi:hypothetical protein
MTQFADDFLMDNFEKLSYRHAGRLSSIPLYGGFLGGHRKSKEPGEEEIDEH